MIVDASVVIGLLDPADVHHRRAADLRLATAGQEWALPAVTLAESLVRHVRAGVGRQALNRLRALAVQVQEVVLDPLQLAELRVDSGLKTPDCIVLATAEALGQELATFDDRLARTATARGVRVAP